MENKNTMENNLGITQITLNKKIHAFCRLGKDWYTNQLTISFTPVNEIPDYVVLDKMIEAACEQRDLIIEEVVAKVYSIIETLAPSAKDIYVASYVDDSIPKAVQVKVEKFGN